MNVRRNKELEIKIVNLTDLLIQNVIAASLKDPEEKPLVLEEAEDLILQLSELIHDLIQDEQHLESMLNQLVFQKLPGEHILESFEDFNEVLSTLIEKGVHNYRHKLDSNNTSSITYASNPMNEAEALMEMDKEVSNNADLDKEIRIEPVSKDAIIGVLDSKLDSNDNTEEILAEDGVMSDIKRLYPDLAVYKNISYKGVKFQYYIPEKKIAIEIHENPKKFTRFKGIKDLVSAKEGIRIIKIPLKYSLASIKNLIK